MPSTTAGKLATVGNRDQTLSFLPLCLFVSVPFLVLVCFCGFLFSFLCFDFRDKSLTLQPRLALRSLLSPCVSLRVLGLQVWATVPGSCPSYCVNVPSRLLQTPVWMSSRNNQRPVCKRHKSSHSICSLQELRLYKNDMWVCLNVCDIRLSNSVR